MRYLGSIIALGLLVAFHELGHLALAKAFRLKVHRFAVGFGPPLFTFKRGAMEWVLGAIPFGGYVVIRGMNPHDPADELEGEGSFARARAWQKAVVLLAGSLFNYGLGVLLMAALLTTGTHVPVPLTVGSVQPGSEAARAQLKPGDQLLAINGERLSGWGALVEKVNDSPNVQLVFTLRREDRVLDLPIRPRPDERGVGRLGVGQEYVYRALPLGEAIVTAFAHVNGMAADGVGLFSRLVRGKKGVELASPIAIVKQTSDAADLGWEQFLRAIVGITVALSVFNLMPLPALDGGRLLFVAIEAATGRKVNPKLETTMHTAGAVLLIGVVVVVAFGEIRRMVTHTDGAATDSGTAATTSGGGPPAP